MRTNSRRLPSCVAISPEALDGSGASLKALDRAVRTVAWERLLTGEIQGPLIAYIGEVIRRHTGGAWEMRLADDGKTWEPWIEDSAGRRYAPFMFAKELSEYGPKASTQAFVEAEVGFQKPAP
jgi:hypothetical protein